MSKDSYYLKFINQALEVAKAIPKYFSKFSNKIFNNHQKLTLLVLRQKLRTTYRDIVELIKITNIPKLMSLKRVPHFTTLIRFSRKLSPLLIRKLLIYSCKISKPKQLQLGVDATGLSMDRGSEHYLMRSGKMRRQRRVIQITACALLDKQLISSVAVQQRKTVVNNLFIPVVKESVKLGKVKYVAADKGYDFNANHNYVLMDLGAISCIKVREKCLGRKSKIRRKGLSTYDEKLYHQRSKIETIFSVIKRKYLATVKGKSALTKKREGMQKVLTYNVDRLCKIISKIILGCHQS